MHDSLWHTTVELPHREALDRHIHREVAIIGGGMTGCLLGFRLANLGFSCVILEADAIGGGQTGGTTAKITAQHGLLSDIVEKAGLERTKTYVSVISWR